MKISWTKNLRLRLAALAAALAATAGLYGVIQAQPLGHVGGGAAAAPAPTQQPIAPAPVLPAPSAGGFGSAANPPAYQPPSSGSASGFAPHVRTRAS